MPYKIIKRKCKQSSGKKGKYIVVKKSDNKKQSCHTSKKKAQSAVRARYANESVLKEYVKILIESDNKSEFEKILQGIINRSNQDNEDNEDNKDNEDNLGPRDLTPKEKALLRKLSGG